MSSSTLERAKALIHCIETALEAGYVHRDGVGNILLTSLEVLEALQRGEVILVEPPGDVQA